MSASRPRHGLVTAAVLLICAAILTLFTDIETRALRRLTPTATPSAGKSR
ncbi:MAG: hypothetical protein VKO00_10770 [Cyanobacteriota bacterium]|jgi:hypothetical protein|nr:hypothetical protein [Cyanobacteriota bacterium]